MVEQKKYQDIVRLGHRSTVDVLKEGDHIVIQEKIDGANASFRRVGNELVAFSRRQQLTPENTLGGFYEFVKSLDIHIGEGLVFFGEWTNPHKVKYPEHEKKFFLYDIYDLEQEKYLPFEFVKNTGKALGLNIVPVFYEGEYQGFDHLMSFVGKTELGGKLGDVETGEGIVVKNIDYLDRFGKQKFVKLVTDNFREVQKQKAPKDPKIALTAEQKFVDATVTEARIDKMLHKFVDEGILDENFGIEDMGTILKNMGERIKEDILKEEGDSFSEIISDGDTNVEGQEIDEKQLSRAIGRTVPKIVKQIINK
ncbi:RNA ligase family protein [Bacillus subtilis]|uniref:RNA ligase family protein n=1 Tax=Bacillus subtilis TaxID=1423 RepID=UPI002ED0013C